MTLQKNGITKHLLRDADMLTPLTLAFVGATPILGLASGFVAGFLISLVIAR
jgi:hypothetical protein